MDRDVLLFLFWVDMAVPIFMILSGYVYTKSFVKKEIATFEDAYRFRNIIPKIVRFMVPFLMVYVLELCIISLIGQRYALSQIYNGFLCGGFGPGSYS